MSSTGWIVCAVAAWLVGSIPFGVVIGRAHGVDIRAHGSRNIGATNVGRVLGRKWGFLCFALDALKGAVPVAVAGYLGGVIGRTANEVGAAMLGWWLLVVAAAVVGHMWSPFIGFKGGKGVATGFGALVGFWPLLAWPALVALAIWLLVLRLSRMISLASMIAALSLPVSTILFSMLRPAADGATAGPVAAWTAAWPIVVATALLAALVVVRHRANLGRILRGEEPRVGARGRAGAAAAGDRGAAPTTPLRAPGASPMQNAPDGGA